MTDKDYSPHEVWCDTQNKISDWCNCMAGTYIEEIERLKAIVEIAREWATSNQKWCAAPAGEQCTCYPHKILNAVRNVSR